MSLRLPGVNGPLHEGMVLTGECRTCPHVLGEISGDLPASPSLAQEGGVPAQRSRGRVRIPPRVKPAVAQSITLWHGERPSGP